MIDANSKCALVTGADRGLGCALVKVLLQRGYEVIAGEYNKDWSELNKINDENLFTFPLDITCQKSVDELVDWAKNEFAGIDLLVNNAGIINKDRDYSIGDRLNADDIQKVYELNAIGALRMCNGLIPEMKGIKRICFISSEAGSITNSFRTGWYAYSMSKAALNMAATIMFNDLRPRGYTFRVLHPGNVNTYMDGSKSDDGIDAIDAAKIAINTCLDLEYDEDKLFMIDENQEKMEW